MTFLAKLISNSSFRRRRRRRRPAQSLAKNKQSQPTILVSGFSNWPVPQRRRNSFTSSHALQAKTREIPARLLIHPAG